jgi:hypothetical protein
VITEDEFKEQALDFLNANAQLREPEKTGWGEGSDAVGLFPDKTPQQVLEEVEAAKAWRQKAFDAGFGWITGPE